MKNIEFEYEPTIGEYYLVPCLVWKEEKMVEQFPQEELCWLDLDEVPPHLKSKCISTIYYTPVLNHPHNDVENGQKEIHYHIDTRFPMLPSIINDGIPQDYYFYGNSRPLLVPGAHIEHLPMLMEGYKKGIVTSTSLIGKSKLTHHGCIHKMKCPHRGYDLTNEPTVDGIITCPLHGLKFSADTYELITELLTTY